MQTPVLGVHVEFLHTGKFRQERRQVRISPERLLHQFPDIVHRIRDTRNEMRLLLEISPEAVCAKHLQRAEQHEQAETVVKMILVNVGHIWLQCFQISPDQVLLQVFRIAGPRLPDERRHVIIDRTAAASLEINEIRLAVLHHHIPGLEITI